MKLDRLIGILTVLQRKGKVTAPYLAETFEVSRRTILRDVETLSQAGLPIVTAQGGDGGISLMEGFSLDTALLTREELAAIVAGLGSLDSVAALSQTPTLVRKLADRAENEIVIDLASFYKESLSEKINLLKSAIRARKIVEFRYYYAKGVAEKRVEPYRICFKWSDWYVLGFCTGRQDFRLYKLQRLWDLRETAADFAPREIPPEKLRLDGGIRDDYVITALFRPEAAYRIVEEFGPGAYTEREDGLLEFRRGYNSAAAALSWLLSFGSAVTVTDPPELVELMRHETEHMAQKYRT
ncbi:MAG: YafY family transcriptional regulator [Clostridia bacterium]|nr:YafY family transcriptional regulator [Clostridia bacterium]